jgi:hypothetical protein
MGTYTLGEVAVGRVDRVRGDSLSVLVELLTCASYIIGLDSVCICRLLGFSLMPVQTPYCSRSLSFLCDCLHFHSISISDASS